MLAINVCLLTSSVLEVDVVSFEGRNKRAAADQQVQQQSRAEQQPEQSRAKQKHTTEGGLLRSGALTAVQVRRKSVSRCGAEQSTE
ncbi:hypothetical protein LSTR_LSTR004880 [Laodelphax striatellus]|uniref:Secreted protein n=1 Tax=Laodelphax striatellus TaxID=195883 RepID=A0A482XPT6_LAOST|nr:hypothetical protein LSTR_LSTR004880 [Laodelphax striatellus]